MTFGTRTVAIAPGTPVVVCTLVLMFVGTVVRPVADETTDMGYSAYWVVADADGTEHIVHASDITTHADYPHTPGYLADCPACEAACHCTGDPTTEECASADCVTRIEAQDDARLSAREVADSYLD